LVGSFSQFGQHAGEDFQAKVFLISKAIGTPLGSTDLVVEALDEPQRHLVLLVAVGFDAIPMGFDHPGGREKRTQLGEKRKRGQSP
jgi:hypothetical protein